ncbi:MAG: extracellular solute-binding protein [Hungatella sp.]|nr:extracellular solute-binding protein [Hungatella sp.]
MRFTWKRMAALGMSMVLLGSMAACGKEEAAAPGAAAQSGSEAKETETETKAGEREESKEQESRPPHPSGPVTIQLWHGNSGVNEEYILSVVDDFNKTNGYGITVEATYAGKYPEILSKTSTAIASGDAPHIIMMSSTGIPMMAETGALADMSEYIARDGLDMDNFVSSMLDFCYYQDQIVTLPYQRSVPILYYNKTMFDEFGLKAPESFEDLTQISKAIYEKSEGKTAGAGFLIDMFFYQEALIRSLGADGILAADGSGPACLDDGSMERVLKDWREGIEAGYFCKVEVTNTSSIMKEDLYNGELGAMLSTSGNLGNFTEQFESLDYELGVCAMPVYGGLGGNIGGGNLGIIASGHSEDEIGASWEFMKFMMEDQQVAKCAIETGYLPVTYSSTKTDALKAQWEANPNYRIAFDILDQCSESSWCVYQNEYESYLKQAASYVIQDFSWTPEEAVEYLKEQAKIVFQ